MESNKKFSPFVTELFLRRRKLNISRVFRSQLYFKVPKLPKKKELHDIASNHSSGTDFMRFYEALQRIH